MATKPGAFSAWPWESLGTAKYVLYTPFLATAVAEKFFGYKDVDSWGFHMVAVTLLRYLVAQLWISLSRFHPFIQKHQIVTKGIKFEQVDREDGWDDYMILQTLVATAVHSFLPGFQNFPLYDGWGLVICLLVHASLAEWIYYWAHRALHHHYLYTRYHSHHHASFATEAITGSVHPFAEHVLYTAIFAIPPLGTWVLGGASISMLYFYLIWFDLMNIIGHCNWEFVPLWLFRAFPPLKYLVYTPTYHSLHHTQVHTNFCLFMPLYDYLGGTVDKSTDLLFASVRKGRTEVPDFVFLAHGTDLTSIFHLPFFLRSFSAKPYAPTWALSLLTPFTLPITLLLSLFGTVFPADKTTLRGYRLQTWVVPRFGFQYFLSFEKDRINQLIEDAIVEADNQGVRVFTLGALNKNEALNGGGTLFVERLKHRKLRVRIVHGNTLTAGAILDKIPEGVSEVFLVGATSKLGRAIALYLSRKGVRVLMMTSSKERFEAIRAEALPEHRRHLVQVTSARDGCNCKTWVVGKWLTAKDQNAAPPGTHFHQFVVPPMPELRKDCSYGKLAAMCLPKDIQGLRACEMTMERGVVHACHAGGLVHALEGWEHHEVGAIDPDRIDITWKAALKHGFSAV